jgi:hypothetical protein
METGLFHAFYSKPSSRGGNQMTSPNAPIIETLTGSFLVSTPRMPDPRFEAGTPSAIAEGDGVAINKPNQVKYRDTERRESACSDRSYRRLYRRLVELNPPSFSNRITG